MLVLWCQLFELLQPSRVLLLIYVVLVPQRFLGSANFGLNLYDAFITHNIRWLRLYRVLPFKHQNAFRFTSFVCSLSFFSRCCL